MSELTEALARLEVAWRRQGMPIAGAAKPGRSREQVLRRLAEEDLHPPQEVLEWFAWHDGSGIDTEDGWAVYGGWLLDLEQALVQYHWQVLAEDTRSDQRGWLPIVYFNGDLVVVDCRGTSTTTAITAWLDELGEVMSQPFWQPSLAGVVRGWCERFETGEWVWRDEDAGLHCTVEESYRPSAGFL